MNYTLHVASPVVFDTRTVAAQHVLNGENVFGVDFLRGPIDGEFGEATGRACIRAKWFLGYPTGELKPTYGPNLHGFLKGTKLPDTAMGNRAALRDKHAKAVPKRKRALVWAVKEIGYKEKPAGSNHTKYGKWYGADGNPWCAMFVSWCYDKAGSSFHYAYVPYIVNDARAGRNGLQVVHDPLPGDVVCYDWDGGVADHTGLFESGNKDGFLAVEGNTSTSSDSNGGEVMRRTRKGSQVQAFVRVGR